MSQWSKQSDLTYVASTAQSWIDDYFSWLFTLDCCFYNTVTLEACQSNYPEFNQDPGIMVTQDGGNQPRLLPYFVIRNCFSRNCFYT